MQPRISFARDVAGLGTPLQDETFTTTDRSMFGWNLKKKHLLWFSEIQWYSEKRLYLLNVHFSPGEKVVFFPEYWLIKYALGWVFQNWLPSFVLKSISDMNTRRRFRGGATGARLLFALICHTKKYIGAPGIGLIFFTVGTPGSIFSWSAPECRVKIILS